MPRKSTSIIVMTQPVDEGAPLLGQQRLQISSSEPFVISTDRQHLRHVPSRQSIRSDGVVDIHAPGVARMTAVSSQITSTERVILFFSIFLVGYAYGLESQVRGTYQPYATSSFQLHSYLATINVLRSVVAVAAQPTAAKIADVLGRFEVVAFSTALYVVGIAMEAAATSVETFCIGAIIYQIGYTCIVLLMEVLVADFSSMRARVFFSYVPAIPFLINTWISGNITSAVLEAASWRWGIGMWAIIYPLASLPLLVILYVIDSRFKKQSGHQSPLRLLGAEKLGLQLFHQLDIVGLSILVFSFSFLLAPLTVNAQGSHHWSNSVLVVPFLLGGISFPLFILWERHGARIPLIPFDLLVDRDVWSALAVRSLLNFAWYTQGNYLYTVLIVAFDFPIDTATRILSFFSFFGVLSGVAVGLIIFKLRRLKLIIVSGTIIFMASFGLLIRYSGGADANSQNGLIGAQVLLGLSGGLFAYPTQASIQASAKREHVAIITGLYLSFYNVGSAFGQCVSGAIWTSSLLPSLEANLAFQSNHSLARSIYDSPFEVVPQYPVGTEVRAAVIDSYQHIQQMMCIVGMAICVPMIGFALALRDPKLSEDVVQVDAEEEP